MLTVILAILFYFVSQCSITTSATSYEQFEQHYPAFPQYQPQPLSAKRKNYNFIRFGRGERASPATYDYIRFGKRSEFPYDQISKQADFAIVS